MKITISLIIVALAIVGLSDATYLSYAEFNQVIVPCGESTGCDLVLTSPYSKMFGVPIVYFGLIYYSTILILAIFNFLELELNKLLKFKSGLLQYITTLDLLQIATTTGFIFSIYLMYIMIFVIGDWCKYCLLSAMTSMGLFFTVMVYEQKFKTNSSLFLKSIWYPFVHWVYSKLMKPVFFLIDPERVHVNLVRFGSLLAETGVGGFALSKKLGFSHVVNNVEFDGIKFPNRVGLSAGFDYNADLTQTLPKIGFGWHTIGTITLEAYQGNPVPRLGRFPSSKGLLVNKGLKNLGAVATIAKLKTKPFHIPTGISIASTNKHFNSDRDQILDIVQCFSVFESSTLKHHFYELNISCPNTFGGEPFTTPNRLDILLAALDGLRIKRPIYLKMPIDQGEKETLELLKVADQHHIQGVIFGNLTKDKHNPAITAVDAQRWQTMRGNVSGKPTFERSNQLIALTKKHYPNRFTIVGTGGIFSAADAQLKLDLGADLLQLITGMIFEGPQLIGQINLELAKKSLVKIK